MNKAIRSIVLGAVTIALILAIFLGSKNERHYAVVRKDYDDEMNEAVEAYGNMDAQSQQQMLASVNGLHHIEGYRMDIDTMLISVHHHRMQLLDNLLKSQVGVVHARDLDLKKLHGLLNETNAIEQAIENNYDLDTINALMQKLAYQTRNDALESRKQALFNQVESLKAQADAMIKAASDRMVAALMQQSLAMIADAKSIVYAEINAQNQGYELDMLRLQSLKNEKNLANKMLQEFLDNNSRLTKDIVRNFN